MKLWRGQPDNWKPQPLTKREMGNVWLTLGAIFLYFAFDAYLGHGTEPTGRWRWLHTIFRSQFGESGDVVLFSIIGTASLVAGAIGYAGKK